MRYLVTGGTGFIGSNIAMELQRLGHEVLITGGTNEEIPKGFKGKVLYPSFVGLDWDAIGKVDGVLHQAANNDTTLLDKQEMFRINVDSSLRLFEQVVKQGCKRIVYASSTAVYGNGPAPYKESQELEPLNPYAESKAELDRQAMAFAKAHPGVTVVGLRYCNVYGPGEAAKGKRATMIYQLAQQMLKGNPRIFKHGEQKRDYIYVKDVVTANVLGLKAKESCVVNCGAGEATSFNDIVAILNEVLGLKRKPEYIDNPYIDRYQNHTQCDMSLAKQKLGFVPQFPIRKGIRDYFENGFLVKTE
ncbi:MAG: NAD-dependent epimerase/dehydratase family protein [Nanoarchaeota archaeon]